MDAESEHIVRVIVREEIQAIAGGVLDELTDGPAGLSAEQQVHVARAFDTALGMTRATYHGVEIPDDIWMSWNDPNSSEASSWRRGVVDAKHPLAPYDLAERDRLEAEARVRDEAEQAAFEEKNKDNPAVQNLIRGRKILRGGV